MDSLQIIQHFFTRLRCHFCSSHFKPDGVQLVREDQGVFLVNVCCSHCERHAGLAMVSLDKVAAGAMAEDDAMFAQHLMDYEPRFRDPELTNKELKRLADFEPISDDDVLDAHNFFENLDGSLEDMLKQEMQRRGTALETEAG